MRVKRPIVFKETVLPPVLGPVTTRRSKSSPRRTSIGTTLCLSIRGWRAFFKSIIPFVLKRGSVAFCAFAKRALAKIKSSCVMTFKLSSIASRFSAAYWLRLERIISISACSFTSNSLKSLFSFTIAIGSTKTVEPVEDWS